MVIQRNVNMLIPYGVLLGGLLSWVGYFCHGLSAHPRLLVVSFDGFWYRYLDLYQDVVPNLLHLVHSGASSRYVKNQFITKTFPNHHSIVTGLYEENHGIVANEFFDPKLNDTFHMNNTEAKWWDTGAIPIWILNQMQSSDRYSGGMMWPGTDAVFKNQTAFYTVPYDPAMNAEEKINISLQWFTNSSHPANCVLLYFDQPDIVGHEHGPRSSEVKQMVAEVDRLVGYMNQRMHDLELHDHVNVILTSDHGMAEINGSNVIEVDKILNHSYVRYGSSPNWAIYPDSGQEEFVFQKFKDASNLFRFIVYKKEEIPDVYHYKHNGRVAPIVLVAQEHYDLGESSSPSRNDSYGNHGYNNSVDSMHPFFIAYGPDFQSGARVPPFQNVDLYPLMCHLLKLSPKPNNGSLINVIHLLQDPFGVRITGTWLLVICALLVICIVLAVVAAFFSGASKRSNMERLEGNQYVYRTRKSGSGSKTLREGEENMYLLVPAAVDEV